MKQGSRVLRKEGREGGRQTSEKREAWKEEGRKLRRQKGQRRKEKGGKRGRKGWMKGSKE